MIGFRKKAAVGRRKQVLRMKVKYAKVTKK